MTEKIGTVDHRTVSGAKTTLHLSRGRNVSIRRTALVSKGDEIYRNKSGLLVKLSRSPGFVQLTPAWRWSTVIGKGLNIRVKVKEIVSEDEFAEFEQLTQFHYRGKGGMGRSVSLIAKVDTWDLPSVIGFIELSSTFIVNTARARFLNAQFVDKELGTAWHKWDAKTAKTFSNSIVRISRCVVYPELRGLGLSNVLVEAAIRYARERWHLAGLRPSFIEITAEMLRFWPFVKAAGFEYVGETEGNQHRAAKDMRYLVVRDLKTQGMPKGGGGIMGAQRAYAKTLVEVMNKTGYKIEEILSILQKSPEKLSNEEWVALHSVYRRPKPVYLKGLTESAENFIKRRVPTVEKQKEIPRELPCQTMAKKIVEIKALRLVTKSEPRVSERSRRVQEAFGIVTHEHSSTLIDQLNLTLYSGDIVLIAGPSGSGKSLLIQALRYFTESQTIREQLPTGVEVEGKNHNPPIDVSCLRPPDASLCPLELLPEESLEGALELLAAAGLAEPHLYVRPSETLSTGQKYRLSIAIALAKKPDLLLVDEFCEPLDRYTSMAVCKRLKKMVTTSSLAAVVATADPMRILQALQPNYLLLLTSDGRVRWHENPTAENLLDGE